ncbi:glycosyltransferase family 4 protein [Thomasclavelia cocleata]|nr:glycosyltransferase family 4 protein [Thomasclavelia cocleata]
MKIMYITNIPSPYRVEFFNELNKYCDLTVLFERKKACNREDKWYSNSFNFKAIFLNSKNIGNEAGLSFEIIKYLKEDFNHIILGGYSTPTAMIASIYMRLHKIPYILNADGGFINENEKKLNYLIKKYFISSASYWLSSGKETNKYLKYYGAKKEKIFNFPFTSVKEKDILREFISDEEKKKLRIKYSIPYKKVIISIGQFISRKGFDWMIETYKDLDKDIGIYIIGGKPTEYYIELKNQYQMDNLYFIDFQSKENILNWYRLADLFVFPTREDIWGLVINEAMSQGVPIITTDKCLAGLELIQDEENGYIVQCENKRELLEKTKQYFNLGQSDKKNIQCAVLKAIEKYSIENMAKEHINILGGIYE